MFGKIKKFHHYCESIPDRLYPFKSQVEGKIVRGLESYKKTIETVVEKHGPNKLGLKIHFYRAAWHFVGSVLLIVLATFLSKHLFGTEVALYVLLGTAIVALFVQEFYSHPKRYNQPKLKNYTDWLTWAIPILIYLFFFI